MFFKVSGLEQGWQTFWRARTQIFGEILSHAGNLSLLAPHFRLFPATLSTPYRLAPQAVAQQARSLDWTWHSYLSGISTGPTTNIFISSFFFSACQLQIQSCYACFEHLNLWAHSKNVILYFCIVVFSSTYVSSESTQPTYDYSATLFP